MSISKTQVDAILRLSPPKRYAHFIKRAVGWGEIWGLYKDGWVSSETDDDGSLVFPMWPDKEYAEICAENEWSGAEPRAIPLDEILDQMIPYFREKNVLPGIFGSITVSLEVLEADLKNELLKYE
jgi:hypothetical protein